ncbi:MAG: molybdenum cofactor guanylyltransferase [Planctomycetota bacterium]
MRLGSIILAGGQSNRMGKPKAALSFADNSLLGRAVDMLLSCTYPVVVVARDARQAEHELPPVPVEADVIHDAEEHQGCGPLAGLLAGLRHVGDSCDAVFMTGCDLPFLTPAVVEWLAEQLNDNDLVMPEVGGVLQPLSAIYRTRIEPTVGKLLVAGDRSLHGLANNTNARILSEAAVTAFDPSHQFLRGVNSPEEYEAALRKADGS